MTIKLLTDWPYKRANGAGYVTMPAGAVVGVFDAATEAGMIAAKVAIASAAAADWTPPSDAGIYDQLNPAEVNQTRALVSQAGNVEPAYRGAAFGNSLTAYINGGSQIGGAGANAQLLQNREPAWIAAYMGDAEFCGNYGITGDVLISSASTNGWNGTARTGSKTFANLIAGGYDFIYCQWGINDLPAATSAALIAEAKLMVSALLAAGQRVVLENIMTFDPTAASAQITPANAAATLVKINEFRDAMAGWIAGMDRAVFVDNNPLIALANGYADPLLMSSDNLGVHPNKRGAQILGKATAAAVRALLPQRKARAYTIGPVYQPNLIEWGGSGNLFVVNSIAGTTTATTPTWGMDPTTGEMYAEVTITPTALASGTAQARLEIHATNVNGGSPKNPVFIGDMLQGSARVVIDDGAGRPAAVQGLWVRQRMYNTGAASQFLTEWGNSSGSGDLTTMPLVVEGRVHTPPCPSPIASANIGNAAAGGGYHLLVFVEATTLAPVRVRVYSPCLRAVSRPQPLAVTAGTSPYIWQHNPQPFVLGDWINTSGRDAQVTVAPGSGGTITQIALIRGSTVAGAGLNAVNTGLTSGVFVLKPGDAVQVTWATVAAQLTVNYL